jgi:hypothetical protein
MYEACWVKSIQGIVSSERMEVSKSSGYGIVGAIPLTHHQIYTAKNSLMCCWRPLRYLALVSHSQPRTVVMTGLRLQHMEHSMSWTVWTTWAWVLCSTVTLLVSMMAFMSGSLKASISLQHKGTERQLVQPSWTDSVPGMPAFKCVTLFMFTVKCPFCWWFMVTADMSCTKPYDYCHWLYSLSVPWMSFMCTALING